MSIKQKMKVYHGLPKSATDKHTVFYSDLDGTLTSNHGEPTIITTQPTYLPTLTGLGANTDCEYTIPKSKVTTIDFIAKIPYPLPSATNYYVKLKDSVTSNSIEILLGKDNTLHFDFKNGSTLKVTYLWVDINWEKNLNNTTPEGTYFRFILDPQHPRFVKVYINGKLFNVQSNKDSLTDDVKKLIIDTMSSIDVIQLSQSSTGIVIADLNISDIDRGEYFSNIPQDFLVGEATVKSRMNQQQVKGDPMYGQVTDLLVPTEAINGTKYSKTPNSDTLYTSLTNPELSARGATNWSTGSKIKIKGLNGELISGVLDADTALCKVTKDGDGVIRTTHTIYVDDTSKIEINDLVKWVSPNLSFIGSLTPKVTAKTNDSITLVYSEATPLNIHAGDLYFEVTASSSSPIVKTQDGVTVVGTWSDLGTPEATFTIGENTDDISKKDLYVTYSLNIPYGNSDFPELPVEVLRGYDELGNELKPVDSITIVDDFQGKIYDSTLECPHVMKNGVSTTNLLLPNVFQLEATQVNYNSCAKLDTTSVPVSNNTVNTIPQSLFSFNLIEIIERKLGCSIPSQNKIKWLEDNLELIRFNWTGYGECPSGSYAEIQLFDAKLNKWTPFTGKSHTNNTDSPLSYANGAIPISSMIDSNGYTHLIAFTKATDGVTRSKIVTNYVSLDVQFKLDASFVALYGENTRARENTCNPILVQKETKTIKRYLPSNECFSTECLYVSPGKSMPIRSGKPIIDSDVIYITTLGTGKYNPYVNDIYRECVAKLGIQYFKNISPKLCNETIELSNLYETPLAIRFMRTDFIDHPQEDRGLIPKEVPQQVTCVALKPFLTNVDGKLVMTLSARHISNGLTVNHTEFGYELPYLTK